jgi:hypothetical protein
MTGLRAGAVPRVASLGRSTGEAEAVSLIQHQIDSRYEVHKHFEIPARAGGAPSGCGETVAKQDSTGLPPVLPPPSLLCSLASPRIARKERQPENDPCDAKIARHGRCHRYYHRYYEHVLPFLATATS